MTGSKRDDRVDFVFLARNLKRSAPNSDLLNVEELGLHDMRLPGSFPADIALGIVGRLRWRAEDQSKKFRLTYAVRAWNPASPQPTLIKAFGGDIDLVAEQPSPFPHHESGLMPAQFAAGLHIRVTGYGTVVVDVLLDDAAIASEPFAVIPGPPSST